MEFEFTTPGEESDIRLVLATDVGTGSVMRMEDGEGTPTYWVSLNGRSLESAEEKEQRVYVFTEAQLSFLAGQAMGEVTRNRRQR